MVVCFQEAFYVLLLSLFCRMSQISKISNLPGKQNLVFTRFFYLGNKLCAYSLDVPQATIPFFISYKVVVDEAEKTG